MTRPRKADPMSDIAHRSAHQPTPMNAEVPEDRAATERERAADLLVQLAGASVRGTMDAEEARHDRLLAWMAAEAREALTPAERRELAEDGDALVARVRGRLKETEPSD